MEVCIPVKFTETFYNVGQGLFYSGLIKNDKQQLSFVYDCGSKSPNRGKILEDAVEEFSESFGDSTKKIDLLVISHFHADHVNGLEKLLDMAEVNTVVIPYFPPIVRLYYALANPGQDKWYYEFLSDPVKYFFNKERGIEKIILIFENGGPLEPPTKLDNNEAKLDIKLKNSENQDLDNILALDNIDKDKVLCKNTNGYISYAINNIFWLFAFYNYPIDRNDLESFWECIKTFVNDIKEVIKDIENIKDIKEKCYNKITNNLNNTSLILYNGPHINPHIEDCSIKYCEYKYYPYKPHEFFGCNYYCHYPYYPYFGYYYKNLKYCSTLLTGDISLKFKYDDIKKHFSKYQQQIHTILIPHHGSGENWKDDILQDFKNSFLYPVSFGLENQYGHPNPEVINSILESNKNVILINQYFGFKKVINIK